jgi:hypothetical protein
MVLSPATSTGNLSELESDRTSSSSPHRDFHDGGAAAASTTTTGSLPTLHSGRQLAHKQDEHNTEESNHHNAASTEKTALLEQTSLLDEESSSHWSDKKSYSSTRESIQRTLSNLSDHISRFSHGQSQHRRYERQVKSALKEIDDQTMAFDTLFRNEQKKVVTFYYEKMQELEQRLDNIKESVAQSFGILRHPSDTGGEGGEEGSTEDVVMSLRGGKAVSPFPTHRKHASSMGQKMEEILNRIAAATTTSIGRNASSVGSRNLNGGNHTQLASLFRHPTEHIHLGGMDDDEDFEDDPEMDEKRLAEAESIKRSLVYQYRIAKLLHNYAIMNITGFVKIVKKFDKTVPSEKGRFADALESRNLLNDGKAVDRLAEKYEQQYANWFCDGDIRAAKAQMLTKQGDGLEMDWSQLQLGYRMGMCAVLALWVCWDCVWGLVAEGNSTIGARAAFPVFRACGGLLLLQWFWGCSVFVWTRYRVNYIYLFDLDPRNVSTPIDIFAQAVDNTLMFLVLMLLYYKVSAQRANFLSASCSHSSSLLPTNYVVWFERHASFYPGRRLSAYFGRFDNSEANFPPKAEDTNVGHHFQSHHCAIQFGDLFPNIHWRYLHQYGQSVSGHGMDVSVTFVVALFSIYHRGDVDFILSFLFLQHMLGPCGRFSGVR